MASEDLLKKAVAAFKALSPEQQAEMLEEQRQSWVRGNVGLSRDERGMTSPANTRPASAATDTGLETVAWQRKHPTEGWMDCREEDIPHYRDHGQEVRELSPSSRAEELLAAKDREVEAAMVIYRAERKWRAELEADNAAQAARVKELEKDVAKREEHRGKLMKGYRALEAKLTDAEKEAATWEANYKALDAQYARAVLGGKPS